MFLGVEMMDGRTDDGVVRRERLLHTRERGECATPATPKSTFKATRLVDTKNFYNWKSVKALCGYGVGFK
jgi:hypothetical protein